ncbi:hypothetical protein MLD38_018850 [Melastoma candidum]|uniref:Uncharacterized protein n=1 Tax=Melastoma candidum TaxID=119954 RepID=A0ACB9QV22_9MYRT|nr:hypothetical protein MLD38_018850 [Melastoma candidum]
MFSQKSFRIKHDDKFFSKLLSRENCTSNSSSRIFYYGDAPGAVPFIWESQPGTPIHAKTVLADLDEDMAMAYLPPLTPPPSYHSGLLSGMTPMVPYKKKLRPRAVLCGIFSRLKTRKAHIKTSPSRSSVSSWLSSSSSSNWSRSYLAPSASATDYSRSRFRVHDFNTVPTTMDYYMGRSMMMSRQRNGTGKQR